MIDHLISIVKSMPYSCMRPDTVVQIYNGQDISNLSFGATYASYKEGFFWSRSWEQSGSLPGKLSATMPIVVLVSDYAQVKDRKNICYTWSLLVGDTPDCPTCIHTCRRSKLAIQRDLLLTLHYLISKLTERSLVTLTDGTQIWVSADRLKELRDDRLVKCVNETIYPQWENITDLPLNRDNSIWKGVQFTVCECVDISNYVEIDYITAQLKGEPKCETC